jgi:subtilisin family serine protease
MKRIFCVIIATILTCSIYAQNSDAYIENEFIIWLEQGVDATKFAADSDEGIVPKRLLSKRLNIWLFEIIDKIEQRETKMSNLSKSASIKHIQNNHTNITLRAITPNDPYYSQQWAPAKISLPDTWDEFTTGGYTSTGDEIVVAVIDAGFDLNHEDLSFWKNIYDIPNNGIDDDNNGYIDDYDGWNAYNHNGVITSSLHGTHVAGIAGAIGNNSKGGVSGVNWGVKILPVCGSGNTQNEATVIESYSYVLEMRATYNETNGQRGAFIVATNSSFGVDMGNPANYPIWCSMYDALGNVGILSCAATANENWNIDQVGDVPTACSSEYLIAVTNTTSADVKNTDAGYGVNTIDIGSPGTTIYSTLPNNTYGNLTGTSMATPQVAGVIALMYAAMPQSMIQEYKTNPASFSLSVRQYLLDGADKIPSLDGLVASGRLNAYAAVQAASCATINFTNRTITTDTTVTSCGDINVQNVKVQNGAKLTLDAAGKVNIISGFKVDLGSKFEIVK